MRARAILAASAVALVTVLASGGSAGAVTLPDGRAYELVTPDINNASLGSQPTGRASADGDAIQFSTIDAPLNAHSATPSNYVVATRGAAGWSGISLSPPVPKPESGYLGFATMLSSPDFSQAIDVTDQPLAGGTPPDGQNLYLKRSDGSYVLMTAVGGPLLPQLNIYAAPTVDWATDDVTHVYFRPSVPQEPSDPVGSGNEYEWNNGQLRLIGVLPDGTTAPDGAVLAVQPGPASSLPVLPPVSGDGAHVLFNEGAAVGNSPLYLRANGASTVDVSASQRTVDPDPNPAPFPVTVGITDDGGQVLFTSKSELTNDANTGESAGVATDAGNDMYSYDVASGVLTDLTVATDADDTAAGANVQQVLGATRDGSYVYFVANGKLATGGVSGQPNLYVWHDGEITFVADASGMAVAGSFNKYPFFLTPDGRHAAFMSTDSLTGYDNTDPSTNAPHTEVFEYGVGEGVVCASCRVDGTRPTADSILPQPSGAGVVGPSAYAARVLSDDGGRLFFESPDAVVPQASSGNQQVFEYAQGSVSLISAGDGGPSTLLDASASGNDVFFATHDELLPQQRGGTSAIYDARVAGGFPAVAPPPQCSGDACHGAPTPPPTLPVAATVTFAGGGNVVAAPPGVLVLAAKVSKTKVISGTSGAVKVKVPAAGRLSTSGPGVRATKRDVVASGTVTVKLVLTSAAKKTLLKRKSLRAKVTFVFAPVGGQMSTVDLSLTFKAPSTKRGH